MRTLGFISLVAASSHHRTKPTEVRGPKPPYTAAQMYRALGHVSPEAFAHVESAGSDIEIVKTDSAPATINYKACSLSKATELILQSSDVEQPENGIPFDRST